MSQPESFRLITDGTTIVAASDDEPNGPGVLDAAPDGGMAEVLCQTRIK